MDGACRIQGYQWAREIQNNNVGCETHIDDGDNKIHSNENGMQIRNCDVLALLDPWIQRK